MELLGKWKPMDVEDSLELLSSHYTNPTVRCYAVARLRQADDEVRYYSLVLFGCVLNWSLIIGSECVCVRERRGGEISLEGRGYTGCVFGSKIKILLQGLLCEMEISFLICVMIGQSLLGRFPGGRACIPVRKKAF